MVPAIAYWPVLILATAATVIASQAVITGAFSMTRQAVQVGLLPRLDIRPTSETHSGQIYVPAVNGLMLAGVLLLLGVFQDSHRLASAYGIAVTGTMFMSTALAWVVARRLWKWRLPLMALVLGPIAFVDLTFLASNLVKVRDGGWIPLALGVGLVVIMWTWTRGARILSARTRAASLPMEEVAGFLRNDRRLEHAPGTAVFLTSSPEVAPVALMHNLRHNKVLHKNNVILTVRTAETPWIADDARIRIDLIDETFRRVTPTYGFMESPNIPRALARCRGLGLKFDTMSTTFFLGRRVIVPDAHSAMPAWQDRLFIFLGKNAANPTDFFHLPPSRVVELGTQVEV
jgi:KUP system potassium uptake protein